MTTQPIRIDVPQVLNAPAATSTASSDHAVIARIAAGDRSAMQPLFLRHNLRVYRFILRLVGDQQLAEDLVSEVFLDVFRNAAKFQARSEVSTWILAIARFKALSSFRRRQAEGLDDAAAAAIADPGDDPEVAIEKKDRSNILRKCLSQLSTEHREIVDLVYYQEMAIHQIAAILRIPENTVKTRMFYARKQLSALLAAAGVDRNWPIEARAPASAGAVALQ